MDHVTIETGDHIPSTFGSLRKAILKSTVRIRQARPGGETFDKPWGTLTATPQEDLVIVQDSGEEYPIKRGIFAETYEETEPGRYRKIAQSRLVQVPEGTVALLKTLEGDLEVRNPDFIVVGEQNEVYANDAEWVEANLEFVS